MKGVPASWTGEGGSGATTRGSCAGRGLQQGFQLVFWRWKWVLAGVLAPILGFELFYMDKAVVAFMQALPLLIVYSHRCIATGPHATFSTYGVHHKIGVRFVVEQQKLHQGWRRREDLVPPTVALCGSPGMEWESPTFRNMQRSCLAQPRVGAVAMGPRLVYIFLRQLGVPKVERINMLLYGPHPSALVSTVSVMVALMLAMALPVTTLFLSLILFPALAH